MLFPALALGKRVQQEGLEIVQDMGKAGFRRLISLELVPEPAEILPLVRGKQAEKVIRRLLFPLLHSLLRLIVVSVGVARLDLDYVVDQKHRHDLQDIDLFGGIFVEKHRHQRDMPGVLRIVLPAAPVGEISLPEDLLLLVHRKNKINLPLHALVHVFSFSCRPETLCPGRHLLPATASAVQSGRFAFSVRIASRYGPGVPSRL